MGTGKKESCGICKKSCKGEVLKLNEVYFHVQCFNCTVCKKSLAKESFFENRGKYYCQGDYNAKFGRRCTVCQRVADTEVVTALGNTYHQRCFKCSKCGLQLNPGDKVSFSGSAYYCRSCITLLTGTDTPKGSGGVSPSTSPLKTSTPLGKSTRQQQQSMPPPKQQRTDEQPLTSQTAYTAQMSPNVNSDSGLPDMTNTYATSNGDARDELENLPLPRDHDGSTVARSATLPLESPRSFATEPSYQYNTFDGGHGGSLDMQRPGSTGPKFKMNYGTLYNSSYLAHGTNYIGHGRPSSAPPSKSQTLPIQQFHRPENMSYRAPTKRWQTKGGIISLASGKANPSVNKYPSATAKREMRPQRTEEDKEAKSSAHYPAGHRDQNKLPVERDDWPAPPASHYLTGERMKRWGSYSGGDVPAELTPQEREQMQKDIQRLRAMGDSAVAKGILQDLQNRVTQSTPLDPRSSSRAPAANAEPDHTTRYMSAMFASPSRFTNRPSASSQLPSRQNATMPANYQVPKPGYTHTYNVGKSATLPVNGVENEQGADLDVINENWLKKRSDTLRSATLTSNCPSSYLTDVAGLRKSMPTLDRPKTYTYEELKKGTRKLPKDANRQQLESHLSHEDFHKIFEMDYEKFYSLPTWRQNELKHKAELY